MKKKRLSKIFGNSSRTKKSKRRFSNEFTAEELESRVLYSGSPLPMGPVGDLALEVAPAVIESTAVTNHHFQSIDSFLYQKTNELPEVTEFTTASEFVSLSTFDNFGEEFQVFHHEPGGESQEFIETSGGSLESVVNVVLDVETPPVDFEISLSTRDNPSGWMVDPARLEGHQYEESQERLTVPPPSENQVFGLEEVEAALNIPGAVFGIPSLNAIQAATSSFNSLE